MIITRRTFLQHTSALVAAVTSLANLGTRPVFAEEPVVDHVAWDLDEHPVMRVVLECDTVIACPTNMRAGGVYTMIVEQASNNDHWFEFRDPCYLWPDAVKPTLGGEITFFGFTSDGESMYGRSRHLRYKPGQGTAHVPAHTPWGRRNLGLL